MSLRVLIADDEQLSRERLKQFLGKEPETELVAECANGVEAVSAIRRTSPDVAFLDVRMPEMDAFGVLRALEGSRTPAVIFVTAHHEFALRAFEIEAVDYLLKPFDRHRFQTALRRAHRRLQLESIDGGPSAQSKSHVLRVPQRLHVNSGGKIVFIKVSEIDWVSAADNYVELHSGTKTHLLRMSITAFAERFGSNQFVRISRATLVRLDAIKEIHSRTHGDYFVLLHDETSLPGTRNYRTGLGEWLRSRRSK